MFFVMLLDAVIYNIALVCTFALRFKGIIPAENFVVYRELWPFFTLITIFLLYSFGLYDRQRRPDHIALILDIFKVMLLSTMFMVIIAFFARSFTMPRLVILLSLVVSWIFTSLWRSLRLKILMSARYPQKVFIVGSKRAADKIGREIQQHGAGLWEVSGFDDIEKDDLESADVSDLFGDSRPDYVIIASNAGIDEIMKVIFACEDRNIRVMMVPGLYELFLGHGQLGVLAGMPMIEVIREVPRWLYALKRLMDIAVALPALIVFAMFLPVLAIMIKLDSSGAVFFKQRRLGYQGRCFHIYKLRTMVLDAEAGTGPILASKSDNRITRVGRWLRKSRIDEMPQFLNVLTGDMSLVGPRPERPELHEQIAKELPSFRLRLRIKPGITGMAQIYGRYDTSHANKLRYDIAYMNGMSLLLDIRLLFETFRVLFTFHGAH